MSKKLNLKKKYSLWLKSGIIFFLITLFLVILTWACSYMAGGGDGGLLCLYTVGLPLLPYFILFNDGLKVAIIAIIINTLIGMFCGLIAKKLRIGIFGGILIFSMIFEILFTLISEIYFEGLNYILLVGIFLFTVICYLIYYKMYKRRIKNEK